jgi:septum formation protein
MNDIILAADTVVILRGRALGKPKDAAEAAEMLRRLSGQSHKVVTGFAVVSDWGRKQVTGSEESLVRFRKLTEREIEAYIVTGEAMDKAGAYAIQGHAREFVTQIEGPLDNIVGLPVRRVAQVLNKVIDGRTQK